MPVSPHLASMQYLSPSDLHWMAYHEWGDAQNPRVLVYVHDLSRTGRDFDVPAQALCNDYRVICPDVVGRGRFNWLADPEGYVLSQYVSDMVTLLARLNAESVDWFGTSMGDLIGIGLAGLPKSPIRRLLLNDVGPRVTESSLTRIGAYLGLNIHFKTFDEGLAYLKTTSASFNPHTPEQQWELNTVILKPQGGEWILHYDPRLTEPSKNTTPKMIVAGEAMLQKPFKVIPGEVLVIRDAYSDLLTRETVEAMMQRGQRVNTVEIPDVGHAPTFIQSDQVAIARKFFFGQWPSVRPHSIRKMSTELKHYSVEHRYPDAVVHSGVVYVAGQVPETTLDAGIAEQAAEVLAIIDRVLATNGGDKTRILMCRIFLKDISEVGEMDKVWDQWAAAGSKNSPPCTTVEAALVSPKYRIEIVVTAAQKS